MNNTEKLMKLAREAGINVEEIVYRVSVEDIISQIDFIFETDDMTPERLSDLIKIGKRGCENIDWASPICYALEEADESEDETEVSDENI